MTLHCTENLLSGVKSEVRTRAGNTAVSPANHLFTIKLKLLYSRQNLGYFLAEPCWKYPIYQVGQ